MLHRLLLVLCSTSVLVAQGVQFPSDARVINVTAFGAVGDGVTDDTAALTAALAATRAAGATGKVVYLPDGVYRVTDTVAFSESRTTLQGQSETGTIIRLDDQVASFSDPANSKIVLSTRTATGFSAIQFRTWIRDLTVETGNGNGGAVGIKLHQNNTGGMRNVTIRSGDGSGAEGLNLTGSDRGPGLVTGLTVEGFDIGVNIAGTEYGTVFENLTLLNQNVVGIRNIFDLLTIRGLTSQNSVPVLRSDLGTVNNFTWAVTVILDAVMQGGSPSVSAIENNSSIYLRNVTASGYQSVHEYRGTVVPGLSVTERAWPRTFSIFPTPERSLGLPILDAPAVPTGPLNTWANVESFGADGTTSGDDAPGIQAAIDSGATTIYFPSGNYELGSTVIVRNAAQRLILLESNVRSIGTLQGQTSVPLFEIDAVGGDVLIEQGQFIHGGPGIHHFSGRTLVLRNGLYQAVVASGPGRTFIEDVVSGPYTFSSGHEAWARQLNPENEGVKVLNDGAKLFVLGIKTEKKGIVVDSRNGAETEILGGLIYPVQTLDLQTPMFTNHESSVSVVIGESAYGSFERRHDVIIEETRGGEVRRLTQGEVPRRVGFGAGARLCLYSGFVDPALTPPTAPLAYYPLDDGSGSTASDASGNGNDGTVVGAAVFNASGILGGALSFDGTDDAVELPIGLLGSDQGAVSMWVNTSTDFTDNGILFYATDTTSGSANGFGSDNELHLHFDNDERLRFFVENGADDLNIVSDEAVADGAWHHVVVSWDRDGLCDLYVDGRRNAFREANFPSFSFSGAMRLGAPNSGTRRYQGLMDDVRIFDRPMEHPEVLDLYFGNLPFANYPPAVDAGLDIALQDASYTATLLGQANDDGQPFGPPTIGWTVASGPGGVAFADATDPGTTATFASAGTYVLRLTASDGAETVFDEVTVNVFDPLPLPWLNQDVGTTGAFGWSLVEPLTGGFQLFGAGSRIFGNPQSGADSFHFAYQEIQTTGFEVIARIESFSGTDPDARAGVMFRASLGSTGANGFLGVSPQDGLIYTNRAGTNGGTAVNFTDPSITAPVWVRILRNGVNTAEAFWSNDGLNWTSLGVETVNTGGGVRYIGLAVTSGDGQQVENAIFQHVYSGPSQFGELQVRVTQEPGQFGTFWVNDGLAVGTPVFNVVSLEPCPGLVGSGPLAGLCASDPDFLLDQVLFPLPPPLSFTPGAVTSSLGPLPLPPGLTFEVASVQLAPTLRFSFPFRFTTF